MSTQIPETSYSSYYQTWPIKIMHLTTFRSSWTDNPPLKIKSNSVIIVTYTPSRYVVSPRAFRCQHGSAPLHLFIWHTILSRWCNWRTVKPIWSAATGQLLAPRTKTATIGSRAFAVCSPTAWNNISVDLRDPKSIPVFLVSERN